MKHKQYQSGFTLIEIIVVIVVLGVLMALSLVTYGNYQTGVRDNVRKSDVKQLAAALSAYATKNNNFLNGPGVGCGMYGNGNGWVSARRQDNSIYPASITQCLRDAGVLGNEADLIDPLGCRWDSGGVCGKGGEAPARAYMKATCTKNGSAERTYVFAALEGGSSTAAEIDALCDWSTIPGWAGGYAWGTRYGMNYYEQVRG